MKSAFPVARLLGVLCILALSLATPRAAESSPPLPIEQLVQQITTQVIQVVAGTASGGGLNYGSAVLMDAGKAITSCHVIGRATEVHAVIGGVPLPAELLASDRFHDLCILGLKSDVRRKAPVCRPSSQVAVGEQTYGVGFASGRLGYSRGRLQARYAFDGGFVLRTGAGFLPGASGGGLFDDRGRLIGVLTFIRRGGSASAFLAVPCEWAFALADGAASPAKASSDAPSGPFWQMLDRGDDAAPRFLQALRLEAEERWTELQALTANWLAEVPDDEGAVAMAALARQQQQPGAAGPAADLAQLVEQDDVQCQSNGGKLVSVRRAPAAAEARVLRVWVERWHLGMKTADRTRHDLSDAGQSAPLGCSRTTQGEQRWVIAESRFL